MLKKLHIDELIVFFILSLGFLLVSWWTGVLSFQNDSPESFPQELLLENNLQIEQSSSSILAFNTLNPSYEIYYSTNGGDQYYCANTTLKSEDIRMGKIDHYPSSLRWRPSGSNRRMVKNILMFIVDPKRKVRTEIQSFVVDPVMGDEKILYLTTSEKGLFDDATGILVGGEHSWNDPSFYKSWYYRNANYTQRGIEWERSAHIQLANNGQVVFNQLGGIRINGHATRGFTQKSFRLNARKQYGESNFKFPFYGEEGLKKYESLVVRQSGNDNTETMFADLLMQNLASGSKVLTQKGKPITLYINGNYWGLYNLRERIDRHMISEYENCKENEVTILEKGKGYLKSGDKEIREEFIADLNYWFEQDEISDKTYEKIKDKVSTKSFMDYIFFETYYGNNDWLENNVTFYKCGNEKWKWVLNDLDFSLAYPGESNLNYNAFKDLQASQSVVGKLFQIIMRNKKGKKKFIERCHKILDEYLTEKKIKEEYALLKSEYANKIDDHLDRWRVIGSRDDWEKNCEKNLSFLLNRRAVFLKQLQEL